VKGKTIIQNILVVTAWLLVGAAMVLLLAAANRKQKKQLCKGVIVKIKGVNNKSYIDKDDILQQLQGAKNILTSKQITEINLAQLELKLEKGSWIKDADLYFDSKNVLHAIVLEREPMARVFTTSGTSFYIDSAGIKMRLLDDTSLRLPVVTNFSAAKKFNRRDSLVIKELITTIKFIRGDSFWSSQIAQIDIT
jgi:cell division protein FtsQ